MTTTTSDTEDDDTVLASSIVWTSDPPNVSGTGDTVTWTPNQTGTFVIIATITDSTGNTVRDTHTITVNRGAPPVISISSAPDAVDVNTPATFTATVSDTEDDADNIDSASKITWTSNPPDVSGTGSSITWTPANTGTYVITATITDSDGNTVSVDHLIVVNPPQASTKVANSLYQQPPIPTQSYTTKVILAHANPITPDASFNSTVYNAIENGTGLWTELYPTQLEFELEAKPLTDDYEFDTQPISVVHFNLVDHFNLYHLGLYTTYYFNDSNTLTFLNHTIDVQTGHFDCRGTYQLYNEYTLSTVIAHELGHYLQIGHTNDPDNLMWGRDGTTDDSFNRLGWNIPADPSSGVPLTIRGLNLYTQLDSLNDEHNRLFEEWEQATSDAERDRYADLLRKNVADRQLLILQFQCIEAPLRNPNSTG